MKRVISFGDSFTAGLGTDREYEESQLGHHPDWEKWTEEEKNKARHKVSKFRRKNSFTKFFADNFNASYKNCGEIGCNNKDILNCIFKYDSEYGFKDDDFVLISFTSSLRDKATFIPDLINNSLMAGITWSVKDMAQLLEGSTRVVFKDDNAKQYTEFMESYYLPDFLLNVYDERYYDIYNLNLVHFIQSFLKYKKVNYIMFDAFEPMFQNEIPKQIDTTYYWEIGKKNIWSYLKDFNDEILYETDEVYFTVDNDRNENVHKHPSRKGHELFTKELIKFYESIYRIR